MNKKSLKIFVSEDKMRKKVLTIIVAILLAAMCMALAACNGGDSHQHSYSSEWSYDDDYHWREATCEHTGEKDGYAEHTFDRNGNCWECGYNRFLIFTQNGTGCTVSGITDKTAEAIVIPAKYNGMPVTSIGWYVFSGCSGLTSITIPDSVTDIGHSAFSGCSGLTSITVAAGNTTYHSAGNCIIETTSNTLILGCKNSVIPTDGSVTSIGRYAFLECSGLTSVTIGNGVTSIGWDAFGGCSGLTSITYNGTKAEWNAISKGLNWNSDMDNYTVTCSDGIISK